jgi:hypothetical protein
MFHVNDRENFVAGLGHSMKLDTKHNKNTNLDFHEEFFSQEA